MPCGFHLRRDASPPGRGTPRPAGYDEICRGPPRDGLRARWLGLLQPARPAGHRRHRAPRRDLRSGGVRRHRADRLVDAGRRRSRPHRCRSARPSTACGAGPPHTCRTPDDLEGWAQLCPDCVGKAGDNGFLRFRLRQALTERGAASAARRSGRDRRAAAPSAAATADAGRLVADRRDLARLLRGPRPRVRRLVPAPRPLRSAAPVHDAAWNAELDFAGRWLDGLPIAGEIVELAAGTGWWSPLLAVEGRAVDLRRARPRRSTSPASGSSRTSCARTSTSATPGPSRTARSMPCSPASG